MVSNGVLYTKTMEKLRFEPSIDESNITVAVKDEGIIVLGGKVKSYIEKRLAEEAVGKIDRVKGVANELEVELIPAYKREDAEIVKAALNALKWTMFIPIEKIKVAVEKGHLTLSGEVEYYYQKEKSQKAVQDLYGVTYVTNNILVKPVVKPEDVKNKIVSEFERHARIDANNINVEVNGSEVTLKGTVRDLEEQREAKIAAWSVPGVSKVVNNLSINWF